MKQTYLYLMEGKSVFFPSLIAGGFTFATIKNFFKMNTPDEIFGLSITIWFVAFLVNLWDIYTGVKADIKRQKQNGGVKFKYDEQKGWKAMEKIGGFTLVIFALFSFENESIRLGYSNTIRDVLLGIKCAFFVYVILIELKSIGSNNEVRFGDKGSLFKLLDKLVEIIDGSIAEKVKKLLSSEKK